jgi:signal transduction histidine kinase/CheY-like chemotaxis protein/PAS domain-containing protein
LITFSINLYFLGLLWFGDKHNVQVINLIAVGVATCYWLIFDAIAGVAKANAYGYMYTMRSIMLVVAPYCFLRFVLILSDNPAIRLRVVRFLLWMIPIADILLVLSNPFHRLVFTREGYPLPEYGPLFNAHAVVAYSAILYGVGVLFYYILSRKPPLFYRISWTIACLVPMIVNVLFTFNLVSMDADIAPFGFSMIFILFALYAYRSRVNHLRSTALSDIFESYQDAVILVDANNTILDYNPAFEQYFPNHGMVRQRNEAIDIMTYLRGHCSDVALLDSIQNAKDRWSMVNGVEFTVQIPTRGEKTFVTSHQEVFTKGKRLAGHLLILSDVSVYRNMIREINSQNERLKELKEMAESASEAKSTFLANMSHEMRTPLNAILGFSELALRRELDGATQDNIEKIHESGRNLLTVINDILDISKIESGRFELVPVSYYTASMIFDTVNLNMVRIGDKPIRFYIDVDETLPSRLYGDELRVRQILNNYLSNAFKYTMAGEVRFSIRYEKQGGDALLTLRVSDTGKGIREEDLPLLFSEYQQADLESNRMIEGTGLGLSIIQRLTELMDGHVDVKSEHGKGSIFTSVIRQKILDETPIGRQTVESLQEFRYLAERREEDVSFEYTSMEGARILVVDDVEINLEVAKGMMDPYGLTVDLAFGGREAVEIVRRGTPRYDLIFMDHMMPDLDGMEAVKIMRNEIATEYAHQVPIVALTANALVGVDDMFMDNGFQGFLAKPIDIRKLDEILKRWVPLHHHHL